MTHSLSDFLSACGASLELDVTRYEGTRLVHRQALPWDGRPGETELSDGPARWSCRVEAAAVSARPEALDLTVSFRLAAGEAPQTAVGVGLRFPGWSAANYVLLPAAVYNGNRFESRPLSYPPLLEDPDDLGPGCPTIISDVARLNRHDGPSHVQQLTRDLSTPSAGFFAPQTRAGFWMLTPQATRLGDSGIEVWESDDRGAALLRLSAPGVREESILKAWKPYLDRGADFRVGDEVTLRARLLAFDCPDIPSFIERFTHIRKDLTGPVTLRHGLPFSEAWRIQEEKTNRENWNEARGYYAVGPQDSDTCDWQLGWVGGLLNTYPMLTDGDARSRERARRTFDFAFSAQAESGLMWPMAFQGEWLGDGFGKAHAAAWHLVRRSGDALYFLIRQFRILEARDPAWETPPLWRDGARRLADALVEVWDRYGQFGQFLNVVTGEMEVGNSTSGALIPGGLTLAAEYFAVPRYLALAEESAKRYYHDFTRAGYTTGGPGEALQCPDSESAAALLESFVTLFEATGSAEWVTMARVQAHQCATWWVSYDFDFPPQSLFGRLDMRTAGAVYANVQNKHGAPGICTLSGVSLLKLFRATADRFFLEMLQETAHNMTQYLSRADRPVGGMPPGWMTERVNLSDWAEGVGEIFEGSCWCEVSNMLTWAEVPGLYVQPDTGFVCVLDHIDAEARSDGPDALVLTLTNPTGFDARVKVWAENSEDCTRPLGQNFLLGCRQIAVPAGGRRDISFPKMLREPRPKDTTSPEKDTPR